MKTRAVSFSSWLPASRPAPDVSLPSPPWRGVCLRPGFESLKTQAVFQEAPGAGADPCEHVQAARRGREGPRVRCFSSEIHFCANRLLRPEGRSALGRNTPSLRSPWGPAGRPGAPAAVLHGLHPGQEPETSRLVFTRGGLVGRCRDLSVPSLCPHCRRLVVCPGMGSRIHLPVASGHFGFRPGCRP